jgi:SAM-dependent methyltransferase
LTWLDWPLFTGNGHIDHYRRAVSSADSDGTLNTAADIHARNVHGVLSGFELPSRRVLEVGCGNGDLLARLKTFGYSTEGIEPSHDGVARSRRRGLKVIPGTFEGTGVQGRYGAIVSTHVVEHVADIDAFFARAAELVEPLGVHVIVTPNGNAPAFKALRRFWTYATPEEHRYIFTAEALIHIGRRHGFVTECHRTTERHCPVARGVIRELVASATARKPVSRALSAPSTAASMTTPVGGPGKSNAQLLWEILNRVEGPMLARLNKLLSGSERGDELLVVMRRT